VIVSAAILFIVIVALAGLGIVVVKALGGDDVGLSAGTQIELKPGTSHKLVSEPSAPVKRYAIPAGAKVIRPKDDPEKIVAWGKAFGITLPANEKIKVQPDGTLLLPPGTQLDVPGSCWGTFTIACTIPIALFVGLYMYRLRRGKVLEA